MPVVRRAARLRLGRGPVGAARGRARGARGHAGQVAESGGCSSSSSSASSRAAESEAVRQDVREADAMDGGADQINLDTLRQQISRPARRLGRRDARPGAAGRSPPSGVRPASTCSASAAPWACVPSPQPELPPDDPRRDGLPREALRAFETHLRRELERAMIERTRRLPPSRPLSEPDRALPSGPLQDLAAVHRIVAQLKRRLGNAGPRAARPPPRSRGCEANHARLAGGRGVPVKSRRVSSRARRSTSGALCTSQPFGVGLLPVGAADA